MHVDPKLVYADNKLNRMRCELNMTGNFSSCISFSHSNLLYFKKNTYLLTTSVNAKYYL